MQDWLKTNGWNSTFLDFDDGIAVGERWDRVFPEELVRCGAFLFLVSRAWLDSTWCWEEFRQAQGQNKKLFVVLIDPELINPENNSYKLPLELKGSGQIINLSGGMRQRFHVVLPRSHKEKSVYFGRDGLQSLKHGLKNAELDPNYFKWPPENKTDRSPYPGLPPLEAVDAGIFFGRDAPIAEAQSRIRDLRDKAPPRFLVVLGASGAGKSSFLRAGLLSRLARDDSNYLPLGVVRPSDGDDGETLLKSLHATLKAHGLEKSQNHIQEAITGGAQTLRPLLRDLAVQSRTSLTANDSEAKPPTLVLAIDQGEELFQAGNPKESDQLLALLQELTAVDDPALLVLITIRSDAFEQLQNSPLLKEREVALEIQALPPMPFASYRKVIEGPAELRYPEPLKFEPQLVDALLQDITQDDGKDALPLLAFTLRLLYDKHGTEKGDLKLEHYKKLGRIKGSIKAAIDNALEAADKDRNISLDKDKRLALLRQGMIPWLAGIDPDTRTSRRRRARLLDIPEEARPLIELLVEQRLLSKDTEQPPVNPKTGEVSQQIGEPMVEVAHESLLRQWDELKEWLEEDSAALINLETVKRAARDWGASKNNDDLLIHRAGRLEEARELLLRRDFKEQLDETGREYLDACKCREEEQQREDRRKKDEFQHLHATGLSRQAHIELQNGNLDRALRFAVLGTRIDLGLPGNIVTSSPAAVSFVATMDQIYWRRILSGHEGMITSAAFSPDGTRIVTASWDDTARIWDANTGKEIKILEGHKGMVNSAAFSPDGTRIITASDDKTARIWDANTGKEIKILEGHENTVTSAAFSPDGTRIVTASRDGTVRIWDANTGKEIKILEGHMDTVTSAAFSLDGTHIVTASDDKTARIWDAATGMETKVMQGYKDSVNQAAFSPDGTRVVTASRDKTARIWDARFAVMPTESLLAKASQHLLPGISKLTRVEMRLLGYPDTEPEIDVCDEIPEIIT